MALQQEDLNKAVGTGDIPDSVMTIVRNNGGGHWNHSFFWKVLAPANSNEANYQAAASDELKKGIEDGWGSLKDFQTKFNEAATAVFGSGWAWLGLDSSGKLVISTTCKNCNLTLLCVSVSCLQASQAINLMRTPVLVAYHCHHECVPLYFCCIRHSYSGSTAAF